MKTLSYVVAVAATLLSVLTIWLQVAEPQRAGSSIRIEPTVSWTSADCPEGRKCI